MTINMQFPNPLTEENLTQINNALDALKATQYQIGLAKRAGIDVSAQETAANDAERRLKAIKSVYFPNR